ncbi:MAG: single-stranded DNA-binding protein, partial [Paraglaciecola chathamensis]
QGGQANQGFNQAPQGGQNKPAPMAEPDFDFDDDIPF